MSQTTTRDSFWLDDAPANPYDGSKFGELVGLYVNTRVDVSFEVVVFPGDALFAVVPYSDDVWVDEFFDTQKHPLDADEDGVVDLIDTDGDGVVDAPRITVPTLVATDVCDAAPVIRRSVTSDAAERLGGRRCARQHRFQRSRYLHPGDRRTGAVAGRRSGFPASNPAPRRPPSPPP